MLWWSLLVALKKKQYLDEVGILPTTWGCIFGAKNGQIQWRWWRSIRGIVSAKKHYISYHHHHSRHQVLDDRHSLLKWSSIGENICNWRTVGAVAATCANTKLLFVWNIDGRCVNGGRTAHISICCISLSVPIVFFFFFLGANLAFFFFSINYQLFLGIFLYVVWNYAKKQIGMTEKSEVLLLSVFFFFLLFENVDTSINRSVSYLTLVKTVLVQL